MLQNLNSLVEWPSRVHLTNTFLRGVHCPQRRTRGPLPFAHGARNVKLQSPNVITQIDFPPPLRQILRTHQQVRPFEIAKFMLNVHKRGRGVNAQQALHGVFEIRIGAWQRKFGLSGLSCGELDASLALRETMSLWLILGHGEE